MADKATVVERPRRLPWGLRRMASDKGVSEIDLISAALASHPTFEGAAEELGCTTEALRKYRRILGIKVKDV